MSSINFSRDTDSADYLNAIRKELAKSKAKDTKSTAQLEYILDFYNQINLSNAVTLNNNKHEFANQINLSNAMTRTDQLTGTFLIDTAEIDFSDIAVTPSGPDFEFDFTDSTGWTQVGTGVSIDTVTNMRIDGFGADGADRRIWYDMLTALSDTAWVSRFPFQYTAQNLPAHHPIGFSSISGNPSANINDYLGYELGVNANESHTVKVDGGTRPANGILGTIITTSLSTQYYFEMIRLSATELKLSIFSDSGYTTDISGSPQTQTIESTIQGLRYIHSSNDSAGAGTRTLTGFVNDLSVWDGVTTAP